jgi:iron(III) transport system substrate-binding protein
MKKLATLLTLCLLFSLIAACGTATTAPEVQPSTAPVAEATKAPTLTAAEEWAKANGFGPYQPAEEDWAAIEEAAKKEGKVVVYANSSKFEKLLEKWAELYPDIALEGGDTDDIAVKMQAEQQAGNIVGDVWYNSDGHLLYGEFVPNQWLWSYVPPGVKVEDVTADRPFAVARHGVDVIGYNSEIRGDTCPVSNWWQFTEPALKGKFFMEDPAADASTTAKITLIVQHADEMAAAYKELYGKEWTTDEMYGPDTPDAGYLFLKKLAKNQPGLQPGGDEVDAAFASLGMDPNVEPGYGWTGLSSLENTMDGELAMSPCYGLKPVQGILKSTYLAVANKSQHPNAAKLFIKFALSEDGLKPWNIIGNYPTVEGVEPAEGMPPRDSMQLWPSDDLYGYQNASKVRDFWVTNLLAP